VLLAGTVRVGGGSPGRLGMSAYMKSSTIEECSRDNITYHSFLFFLELVM